MPDATCDVPPVRGAVDAKPGRLPRWLSLTLWFVGALVFIFCLRTWRFWQNGELTAGMHADGVFHYTLELVRLQPDALPEDLGRKAEEGLGYYGDYFYRSICWLVKKTGWSLLQANLVVCWAGNVLSLGGVMFFLSRLGLKPALCAVGVFLAAQPFSLLKVASGVTHSLAIPREVWFWPVPWLLAWFVFGNRQGGRLLLFYGTLGLLFSWVYPLTAIWFGLAAGIADVWRILRERQYAQFAWLAGAAVLCLGLIAIPALGVAREFGKEDSAILDYLGDGGMIYGSKGFRMFVLIALVSVWAFRRLRHHPGWCPPDAARKLWELCLVCIIVGALYSPIEKMLPSVTLLFLGRISLLSRLIGAVVLAAWLNHDFKLLPRWGKVAVIVAGLLLVTEPRLGRGGQNETTPLQPDFVRFCREARSIMPTEALAIVPPGDRSDYFRVYAERGLWVNRRDRIVLSRSRTLYTLAQERNATLEKFYSPATTSAEREAILTRLQQEGLDFVVTRTDAEWAKSLSWPVVFSRGIWQLRSGP